MVTCVQVWSVNGRCHGEALGHYIPTLSSKLSRHPDPNDLGDAKGGRPLLKNFVAQVADGMIPPTEQPLQPSIHHATDTGAVASEWMNQPHEAVRRGCHSLQ